MKDFSVKFSLNDSEFFTALRLVAGAVCSAADCNVDEIEDFKVCVSESALILKNSGYETIEADFKIDGKVIVEIKGQGGNAVEGDNELSLALVSALMDDCEINRKKGVVTGVTLKL